MSADMSARSVSRTEGVDKVRGLQRVLYRVAKSDEERRFHAVFGHVHREDVLWRAWVDVCLNEGAAGVDGVTIDDVEAGGVTGFLETLSAELREGRYRPSPLRRVWIPKSVPGEFRPLGVPTIRDRVVMTAVKTVLEPIFEAGFKPSSYGFRPLRSAHDANETIRLAVNGGRRVVLDADLRACFDNISHDALLAALQRRVSDRLLLKLIRSWLRVGVIDAGRYEANTGSGCPQGSPLSPLLANIVLDAVDSAFEGRRATLGVLVRYADDIVVVCGSRRQVLRARQELETVLVPLGLELHPDKTQVVDLRFGAGGFTFLGFYHRMGRSQRSRRWVLHRWPSPVAVARIKQRVRELTDRRYAAAPLEWVIERLNQTLAGWGGYFKYGNSNQVFQTIDSYVHWRLTKLARVKHGDRGRGWTNKRNRAWLTSLGIRRLVGTVTYYQSAYATR